MVVSLPISPVALIIAVIQVLVIVNPIDLVLNDGFNQFILYAFDKVDLYLLPGDRIATDGIFISDHVSCSQGSLCVG